MTLAQSLRLARAGWAFSLLEGAAFHLWLGVGGAVSWHAGWNLLIVVACLFVGWLGRMQCWKRGWQADAIVPVAYAKGECVWLACLGLAMAAWGAVASAWLGELGLTISAAACGAVLWGVFPKGDAMDAHPAAWGERR